MSLIVAMLIGFAGTVAACALAVTFWGEWGNRHLPSWVGGWGVLLFVLGLSVSGWIVAVEAT